MCVCKLDVLHRLADLDPSYDDRPVPTTASRQHVQRLSTISSRSLSSSPLVDAQRTESSSENLPVVATMTQQPSGTDFTTSSSVRTDEATADSSSSVTSSVAVPRATEMSRIDAVNATFGGESPSVSLSLSMFNGTTLYIPVTLDILSTRLGQGPVTMPIAEEKDKGSNQGLVIGISVVATVLTIGGALLAVYLCRRKRRKASQLRGASIEQPGPFGSTCMRAAGTAQSIHSQDPLSAVESPSTPQVVTPAQEYASLARSDLSPSSPQSDTEYPSPSKCELDDF